MSIETPVGTLDIKNATLRIGRLEVSNIQGIDTALNVTRANSILIYDDQASTTTFGGFTSTPGVRDTVGGYLDVAGGYVYWGQKLPNAWTMEFEMDIRSGTNAGPLYANVFSTTNTGGDGYSFVYNDSNDKITLMYDGAVLTETSVPGLFTASENWQKVVINYERNAISISLNGQRKFYYKDIERETPYTTGEYVNFSSSSTDGRKIRAFKVTNGDKWTYSGESNITYTHGSLGIGVVDPTATLDVAGTVNATAFVGDGSAITNINSGNIGDFASNVERIASLETDLTSNTARIASLETDLTSNVGRIASLETDLTSNTARIESLETDLTSNVGRIASLETDLTSNTARIVSLETSNVNIWSNLASNVVRIVSLESGDMTISGDKTFADNVFVTTLADTYNKYLPMVNTDGKLIRSPVYVSDSGKYVISASEAEFLGNITLSGNTTVVSSSSVTIEDRIFGIGSNNSLTNLDSGIIIEHQDLGVYANVALIHHADEHRFSLGYTQNTFTDDHILHYDHPDNVVLTVDLRGDVLVQNNLQVGVTDLFVDTTTGFVGVGTTNPAYPLDVEGETRATSFRLNSSANTTITDAYVGANPYTYFTNSNDNDNSYMQFLHDFTDVVQAGSGPNSEIMSLQVRGKSNGTTDADTEVYIPGYLGVGTSSPEYTLDVAGKSRLGTVVLNPQTYLVSNVNYFEYTSSTITTFNKVLLQIDKSGTSNGDHAEYSGYVDCEIVAQRSITNGGPEIFTSRVNFMVAYDDAYDIWKINTFVQENKSFYRYISFTSTPVFKYKYDGRQLQLYVSFDAKEIRSYTSFTARITSDGNHINDISLPGPDELMGTGTDGTAELGICYGLGNTNTSSYVGIGIDDPTYKLDVGDTAPYISVTDTRTSSGGVSGLDLGGIVFRTKDATDPVPETGDFLGKIQMTATNTESFPDGSMNFFVSNRGDLLTTPSITIEGVSGNVGVGTASPTSNLHVVGNAYVTSNLTVGTANLHVDTTTGFVGVGTASPSYKLDVHGTSNVGALTVTSVSGDGSGLTSLNASNISSGTLNKDRLPTTLNNTTIEDANSAILTIHDSSEDNQSAVVYETTNYTWKTGLHGGDDGKFKISKDTFGGTNDYLVIKTSGQVGIGTDSPLNILHLSSDNTTLDASDSATFDQYSLIIHNTRGSNSTNTELGLCFNHYDSSYPSGSGTPGAAITHERTAAWSKGKLHFKTKSGNTETGSCDTRMTIDELGNVGIGTTSPAYTLDVHGTSNVGALTATSGSFSGDLAVGTTNLTHGRMQILCSSQSPDGGLTVRGGDFAAGLGAMWVEGPGSGQRFNIQAYKNENTDPPAGVNASTLDAYVFSLCLNPKGGNVGIGTASPGYTLDVHGTSNVGALTATSEALIFRSGTGTSNAVALTIQNLSSSYTEIENGFGSRIQFRTNRGTSGGSTSQSADIKGYIYGGAGGSGDYHALDLDAYGDNGSLSRGISIYGKGNGTSILPAEVTVHGNLGIGTTSPAYKLDVHGTSNVGTLTATTGTFSGTVRQSSLPAFRVQLTDGTISGTGDLEYDLVAYDNTNSYSSVTGRFTAPVTGHYYFTAQGVSINERTIYDFTINGTRQNINALVDAPATSYAQCTISSVLYLTAGQYVTMYQVQGSTFGEDSTDNTHNVFSGFFIG